MNTWKFDSYSALVLADKIESNVIKTPDYQRGLVWSDAQKLMLADTIKRGLPFGTILLFRSSDRTKPEQIIDGLQRCTTIAGFMKNPTAFFSETDISDDLVNNILDLIGVVGNRSKIYERTKILIFDWVKAGHKSMQDVEHMQYYDLAIRFTTEFPTVCGKEKQIVELVSPTLKQFQLICKQLADTVIPAIVIEGDESVLPDVFERINSKGTPLTKYQIYAATWLKPKYKLPEKYKSIVEFNRDRKEKANGDSIEIDGFDSQKFVQQRVLSVFEIIYGFGKEIIRKYPHLFGNETEANFVDSIGFTLFNACLGGKSANMKDLNTLIKGTLITEDDLVSFMDKLLECINQVNGLLGKYNRFKSNRQRQDSVNLLHTELQIASIVAYFFTSKYAEVEYDDRDNIIKHTLVFSHTHPDWKARKEKLERNIPKVYFVDILQQRWAGSGDKKLDNIMQQLTYYSREITESEIKAVLDNWFDNIQSERAEYKRIAYPKEPERILLNCVYLSSMTAEDQLNDMVFDIEHIAPKAKMKKQLDRFSGDLKLPISSPGNLCLLPMKENRAKKEKTIYSPMSGLSVQEMEARFTFTEKSDLDWIENNTLTMLELKSAYLGFTKKRFQIMEEKALSQFSFV